MIATLPPSTRIDLHVHTDRSDGRFGTEEVLKRAARGGLDVVALTDHDLQPDLQPGPHQIEGRTIHVLAGAEVSGVHDGREYHLLVYFPSAVPEGFRDFCRQRCQERATRYTEALRRLELDGLRPAPPEAQRGDKALTRLHLARAIEQAGHATSRADAFGRYLSASRGMVPTMSTPFTEAIRIGRSFGGLTAWAHPPKPAVDAYLPTFAAAGLQGLEVLRPTVRGQDRRRLRRLARDHDLVLTGGSDWHGWSDPEGLGLFRVEARDVRPFLERLAA